MNVTDRVGRKLTGKVSIVCKNVETGEVRRFGQNLVVDVCYKLLARILGHLSTASITDIAFGIGIVPVDHADVSLTGVVTTIPAVVTYPDDYSVMFTSVWASAASDPANVTEVGLLFSDTTLAARFVFAAMKKSAGWEWSTQWTLSYTI